MAGDLTDLRQSKYWWHVAAVNLLMLYSTVGVRCDGFTSPFKHKYGDPLSRVRTHVAIDDTENAYVLSWYLKGKERKEDAKRLEMALNRTCMVARRHRWMTVPLAVCIWLWLCNMWLHICFDLRYSISFATNSLVFPHLCFLGAENID